MKTAVTLCFLLLAMIGVALSEHSPAVSSDGLNSSGELTGVTSVDVSSDDDFATDDGIPPGNFHAFPVIAAHGLGGLNRVHNPSPAHSSSDYTSEGAKLSLFSAFLIGGVVALFGLL